MNSKITKTMIEEAVKNGWDIEDAKRGYTVAIADYGKDATHIEKLDDYGDKVFASDAEAAEQAEKDGYKIIHDIELPEEHQAAYIDTPENRRKLKEIAL